MSIKLLLVLTVTVQLTFGQLSGHENIVDSFGLAFDEITPLTTVAAEEDVDFYEALQSSVRAKELSAILETLGNFADEVIDRDQLISEFKRQHEDGHFYQELAEGLSSQTQTETPFSRAFIDGLKSVDQGLAHQLMNYTLPSGATTRPKRQLIIGMTGYQWACGLLKVTEYAGLNHTRLSTFLINRVPERWRHPLFQKLVRGGVKGIMKIATVLCNVSSGGGIVDKIKGLKNRFFTEQSDAILVNIYDKAFLGHDEVIDFDDFQNFVHWYRASINRGLKEVHYQLSSVESAEPENAI
ncbi:hypothetical protein HDE_04402 [Halotydeus destructor]|nr:hypothetical protein HDE_04402 [Halotydeus destructor]